MKNVSYTAKTDRFLGAYGAAEKGFAFEPLANGRVTKRRDTMKEAIFDNHETTISDNPAKGDVMYRGMIMMHDK